MTSSYNFRERTLWRTFDWKSLRLPKDADRRKD